MRRALALLVLSVAAVSACGAGEDPAVEDPAAEQSLTVPLLDAEGADKGSVEVTFAAGETTLAVSGKGLPPGLHGFHVHKTGVCAPDSADPAKPETKGAFLSAAGHLAQDGQTHGDHDGDLPSLLVNADGTARLVVTSDRLTEQLLRDADGSALMVHADPDNFGNVPDRYAPAVDDTTKKTGDAGKRLACGALEP